jgi:MoxR-like ATPase
MGEKQTTIEGKTYRHPQPFFVIATQNPVEHFGAFPLPESQMDRFMMQISIGYPSIDQERAILQQGSSRQELDGMETILRQEEVIAAHEEIKNGVYVSDKIYDYILKIVQTTRKHPYMRAGISTRGSLAITTAAKTLAFFSNRDYVIPEDIRELAPYTIPHRIILHDEYETIDKQEFVQSLINEIASPA